jgi:hypothetical protein
MGILRRLFGGGEPPAGLESTAPGESAFDPAQADAAEREHELDLLRGEQERLDELTQRQLRYADYAWQPPPQGGERRADDKDESGG